eukprot:8898124-Karenia_brevis.AAC.1
MSVAISYDMGTTLWRLGEKSVAMSYDFEWSPHWVDEMSVAMSCDIATLKKVVRQTAPDMSLPSHRYRY